MARVVYDGVFKVYYLATKPANTSAPTMAEITAGTEMTPYLTKDGFSVAISNNRVTGGDLSTQFTDESMGTWTAQGTVTAYLDDNSSNNVAWDTLTDFGSGCFVVCPFGAATAGGSADVYPDVEFGVRAKTPPAENTRQKFTVEFACRTEPVRDATVAA